MNEKEFKDFKDEIRQEVRENMREMRQEVKSNLFVIKVITSILGTLFIAFVGIGIKNMIDINTIKKDNETISIPMQMVVIKVNEIKALVVDKDTNAYNRFKEQETRLEIEMLAPKNEVTRGGKK